MRRVMGWFVLGMVWMAANAQEIPMWLRYPAISPDGKTIAFSYKGDLYRVDADGGIAIQLTHYEGHDFMPVWSRDGKTIAFASDRFGNFDIFVMPANGGKARRLTFHSADDSPSDFSPDNHHVLFTSTRTDAAQSAQFPTRSLPETYRVSTAGGKPEMVSTIAMEAGHYDPVGKRIVYQDKKGGENAWRKHHKSSITRDIRVYTVASGQHVKLTGFAGEDRDPVFSRDGKSVFYLSEENGTFNVFQLDIDDPGRKKQLTFFENHPVRFLSLSDSGTLCFGYDGEIYIQAPDGKPQKAAVQIFRDAAGRTEELLKIKSDADEMAVSPNGKEIAFTVRGEVFAVSVESGLTKQITATPGQERSIGFSPDGRSILYAAERNRSWNIYRSKPVREQEKYFFNSTILEEEAILETEADTFQPTYSPDGKEVAFLEERTALKVINLETKQVRSILAGNINFSYLDGDQYYQWSPDGKWFLVQYSHPDYWFWEAGLIATDGKGRIVNLTESGYSDTSPKWMMDGKVMIWFSDRDGLKSHANNGPAEADVFGLFFTQKEYDRFKLTKEEYDLLKEQEKEEKDKEKKEEKGEKESAKKEKDALKPVEIELAGIEDRKAKLTIHSSRLTDAVMTPDGEKLIYLSRFEKGYDLWVTEPRTKETKILAKLGGRSGSLVLDKEGKHVFLLAGGKLARFEIESGKQKSIGFNGEMRLNRQAERTYLFEHVWRQVVKKFYDPNLHGAAWEFFKGEYAKYLPHINNDYDFAEMLSELLGELNASHTGARYRHNADDEDDTASLGLFYDEKYRGNGLKIDEIMPRSPVFSATTKIKPGVIIEKIDGIALTPNGNPYPLLNRKAEKYTLLSLYDEKSGERWEETVKPITQSEESQLRYERWVDQRRELTEKLSGGRIGYVHVRSMSDNSYRTVHDEVFGKQVGKEAIVVDTRFNGGGDLVEDLSVFLSGKRYMDFIAPDQRVIGHEPQRRWSRPSIVIMSEGNYSDAHCFPTAYKELGLGKIVGMPVPGTCTFVWWEPLQAPGLVFGTPNIGVRLADGTMLENTQLEPDIRIDNEPDQLALGKDQQLEAAVTELLKQLNN